VENFFAYMQTPESKQVKLVAYKLRGWALDWWEQTQNNRRSQGKQPVRTWLKMKKLMKLQFLPPDYKQRLYQQYQNCRQGSRSVNGYTEEFYRQNSRNNLSETEVQQQSSQPRRFPGESNGHIPTDPIEPLQSKGVNDDNPTCAHPIPIVVEEVVVPINSASRPV